MRHLTVKAKSKSDQTYEPKVIEPENMHCLKCENKWFELVQVQKFAMGGNLILGQRPHSKHPAFWIFRCVKCLELYETNVNSGVINSTRKEYNDFLDKMEEPTKEKDPTSETL